MIFEVPKPNLIYPRERILGMHSMSPIATLQTSAVVDRVPVTSLYLMTVALHQGQLQQGQLQQALAQATQAIKIHLPHSNILSDLS